MKNLLVFLLILLGVTSTDSLATLKLTCPKGGENFVAGSDTLITWEGILPTDTVKLEYSIDKGLNWKLISDNATGLQYVWKNVPKPTSEQCLIRIKPFSIVDSSKFEPAIEWQKTYGGSKQDSPFSIQQTADGGYIAIGATWSNDGDITSDFGSQDFWVIKLDTKGNVEWKKVYGTNLDDTFSSILQTKGDGYLLVGNCEVDGGSAILILILDKFGAIERETFYSYKTYARTYCYAIKPSLDGGYILCGNTSKNERSSEGLFLKVNEYGKVVLEQTYKKEEWNRFSRGIPTSDGGYFLTGTTSETLIDSYLYLLVKLDAFGNIEWDRTYGSNDSCYYFTSLQQTPDGGYIALGETFLQYILSYDMQIFKFDNLGNVEWIKTYRSPKNDIPIRIILDKAGGYQIFCNSESNDGSFSANKGGYDLYIIKINEKGDIEWQKNYGGTKNDGIAHPHFWNAEVIFDGCYFVLGNSESNDGDLICNNGKWDIWVVKTNEIGELLWQKSFGGNETDYSVDAKKTNDGGFVILGGTESTDIPGSTNKGGIDYYIVKLGPLLQSYQSDSTFSIVAPLAVATDIDMGKCVINTQKDSTVVGFVYNAGTYELQVDSIYLRGTDANDFSILWGSSKHIVKPTWGRDVRFRFLPSRIGLHFAEIVIITQSDTMIRRIQGEGVPPQMQVLNAVIDFGRVIVGAYKDTLQAVTIMNISSGPLTIIKTKHNKPNDYDFTTLAGGGSFALNSGDTAKLDLRFKPSAIGYTYGTLEFYTEGLSIPAVITLKGEGINRNPVLQAPTEIDFNLICSTTMKNYIPIYNAGGDTLRISEINLTGINANEFSVNEVLPMNIPPLSKKNIAIKFKPNSLEIKSADLEIKSNSDPNTSITIPINAKKDSMNLTFVENTIDLGYLCPNQTKDTVIHIKNFGTIKTGAFLTNSQNISIVKNEIVALPNASENILFKFNRLSTEGIIKETITLTDSICGFSKTITITGIIQAPKLESSGVTITCVQLTSNDGILTLKNTSDRNVIIQNPPIISSPFSMVGNPFPLNIPAKSSKDITLRYTAADYTSQSSPLRFFVEPCGITYETTVIGEVSLPKAVIKIDTLGAYPGEIINIPIILKNGNYLDLAGENSFQTDLVFNPTLLTPLNRSVYPVQKIDNEHAKIEIKNIPLTQEIGKTLIEIPFVVGLGNAESCELILQNANVISGKVNIETENGKFKLLGICREGGTRLINPTGKAEILSIIPNPASDNVEIKVYLIEKGISTIELYNSNGVILFDDILNAQSGFQTINLDLKNYDSGLYFIKLHTPTVIDNEKLMIVK